MHPPLRAVVLSVCLVAACGPSLPEDQAAPGQALQSLTTENGSNLNGSNLNGSNLNGNDLSQFMVSVNYLPAKREGAQLDQVWLEDTTFKGVKGSRFFSGDDFHGAEFVGNLGAGGTVRVRINAMTYAPAPNGDLRLYDVRFLGTDGTWQPACRDSSGAAALAMPLKGTWEYRQGVPGGGAKTDDPARFTFACMGGALAKCVLWGYRPWASFDGVSLAAYHQACTRLVRADYCGDGTSYTQNGNLINLYDGMGIQQDTEDWTFEAEWDTGGARCFYPLNRTHSSLPCYDARTDYYCGNGSFSSRGALLRNETPYLMGGPL